MPRETQTMTNQGVAPQAFVLAAACLILLALPFVTTYNDLLTALAMQAGVAGPMQSIAPAEARMVVGLLQLLGIHAAAAGSQIIVWGPSGPANLFISWNCIGWQSLVLLAVSLTVGLRGESSRESSLQVIVVGLAGTVLVNLLRVAAVCLVAAAAGRDAAVFFHDYAGTLITIAWLFAFWAAAQRWLLSETVG